MKIKKYLPLLLSTICVYGSAITIPAFQPDGNLSASALSIRENRVNGRNVKQVIYGGSQRGIFQPQRNGSWIEKNRDGQFSFREVGRDDWSVYLLKSDGLNIQLDLHRQEVILRGQGKLYDIKKASRKVSKQRRLHSQNIRINHTNRVNNHNGRTNTYRKLTTLFLEKENKCFEGNKVARGSTLGGAAFMDDCQNVSGQSWKMIPTGGGYFRLTTQFLEKENKCLEGNKFASGSTLGGRAFMDNCQNVSGQLWKMIPTSNGYFRLTTMFLEKENKCLEGNKFDFRSTLGGGAFMDNCQNVSGQLWKFKN